MTEPADPPAERPADRAQLRRRFIRLIAIAGTAGAFTLAAVYAVLALSGVPLRLHLAIALALGIMLSTLLAGALMGLVFLSARGGHDDDVQDRSQ